MHGTAKILNGCKQKFRFNYANIICCFGVCVVCVILCCMCYSVLYVLFCVVCVILCCMCYSVLYVLFCVVCVILCCMCYSVLYVLFCVVCVILCCMCYSVLYVLFCVVCVIIHVLLLPHFWRRLSGVKKMKRLFVTCLVYLALELSGKCTVWR